MIDYVQLKVLGYDARSLIDHPLLVFQDYHDCDSHEVYGVAESTYKGLRFRVTPSNQLYVDGSLHKFHNAGLHNHDRFTYPDVLETFNRLENEFGVNANNCVIENLEFGVNLRNLDGSVDDILNGLLTFKNQRFSDRKYKHGSYKFASFNHYEIKAYDKGTQNALDEPVMRYEVKYKRSQKLRGIAPDCKTLADVVEPTNFKSISNHLTSTWNDVLLYDTSINSTDADFLRRCHGHYWESVSNWSSGAEKSKHHRERKKFKQTLNDQSNLHQNIGNAIRAETERFYPIYSA